MSRLNLNADYGLAVQYFIVETGRNVDDTRVEVKGMNPKEGFWKRESQG